MSAVMELTIAERIGRARSDVLLGSDDAILESRQLLIENNPVMEYGLLVRSEDVSGISGTGDVALIERLRSGVLLVRWVAGGGLTVWASTIALLNVHGHDGRTIIEWSNGTQEVTS
jgi:hypothetical protein